MKTLHTHPLGKIVLALALMIAGTAYATTSGPANTLPQTNVVMLNNQPTPKGESTYPQIAVWVVDSTGAASTATTIAAATALVNAAHLNPTVQRGNMVGDDATGFTLLKQSGLYKALAFCNATAQTTETVTLDAATTTDGSTFTEIPGANARYVALTGTLSQNLAAGGYFTVTSAQATAATFRVAARLADSGGATNANCKTGTVLMIERVDSLQPAVNP